MRIQNNVSALNAHRFYGINQTNTQKSIAKLSSGYRINSAADDAAGLAISEKMRAQIRGLTMASKNTQDAISLIQTAEGGMQEIDNMLQRIRELTVYASNDTNDLETGDRQKIQDEIDSLIGEIDSMAERVEFNNKKIINGSFSDSTKVVEGLQAKLEQLQDKADKAMTDFTAELSAYGTAISTYADATSTFTAAGQSWGKAGVSYNNATASYDEADKAWKTADDKFKTDVAKIDPTASSAASDYEDAASIWNDAKSTYDAAYSTYKGAQTTYDAAKVAYDAAKSAYAPEEKAYKEAEATFAAARDAISKTADDVSKMKARVDNLTKMPDGSELYFQIGANSDQKLVMNVGSLKTNILGIGDGEGNAQIDVRELSGSEITELIDELDEALLYVTTERSKLGAAQNRLEYTMNSLDISAENLTAAESRIRDVDMAKEMSNFTKQNILFQASIAMLAQANAFPQGVLQLLG